jgi:hypothetical protein
MPIDALFFLNKLYKTHQKCFLKIKTTLRIGKGLLVLYKKQSARKTLRHFPTQVEPVQVLIKVILYSQPLSRIP